MYTLEIFLSIINLHQKVRRQFHYFHSQNNLGSDPFSFGVKDDIDYSNIKWLGKQYDQHELMIQQLQEDRANL